MPLTIKKSSPLPLGVKATSSGYRFSVFAQEAKELSLDLFHPDEQTPFLSIPFDPAEHKTGHLWHGEILDLKAPFDYLYTIDGKKSFFDPYGLELRTEHKFGASHLPYRSRISIPKEFDWKNSQRAKIAPKDLYIYEVHVRSFTIDPSSHTSHPGTFSALIEKLPYLQKLGITAIELMPVFEFDETNSPFVDPDTGERRFDVWGYNPISFFAVMGRFSYLDPMTELKELVRQAHLLGMAVFLDVVYNHTGEEIKKPLSLAGLGPSTYYLAKDYSGCGNSIAAYHPVTADLILTSLRYFYTEYQIDGFRFDLASALLRTDSDQLSKNIIEAISFDPLLADAFLIAEPWDAQGLYLVHDFPCKERWILWTDLFRDRTRRFANQSKNSAKPFVQSFLSTDTQDIDHPLGVMSKVHFITCHDGFCLQDLVSYKEKHNLANGQDNEDGHNNNESDNYGVEGPTNNPSILHLRDNLVRFYLATIYLSRGIPMLWMGDEIGMSRKGNNNPWNQDKLNAYQWGSQSPLYDYIAELIALRKKEPLFSLTRFFDSSEIHFHGTDPSNFAWHSEDSFIAFSLYPKELKETYYFAFNALKKPIEATLPEGNWSVLFTSSCANYQDGILKLPEKSMALLKGSP